MVSVITQAGVMHKRSVRAHRMTLGVCLDHFVGDFWSVVLTGALLGRRRYEDAGGWRGPRWT